MRSVFAFRVAVLIFFHEAFLRTTILRGRVNGYLTRDALVTRRFPIAHRRGRPYGNEIYSIMRFYQAGSRNRYRRRLFRLMFVRTVLHGRLILCLRQVRLFSFLHRFQRLHGAIRPRRTYRFHRRSSRIRVGRKRITTRGLVNRVAMLRHTSRALCRRRTKCSVVLLAFHVSFISNQNDGLRAYLLGLRVNNSSPIGRQGRRSRAKASARSNRQDVCQMGDRTRVHTIIHLDFRVGGNCFVRGLLCTVKEYSVVLPTLAGHYVSGLYRYDGIFAEGPLICVLPFRIRNVFFRGVLAHAIVFFPLGRYRQGARYFIFPRVEDATMRMAINRRPRGHVRFSPFSFHHFGYRGLSVFWLRE